MIVNPEHYDHYMQCIRISYSIYTVNAIEYLCGVASSKHILMCEGEIRGEYAVLCDDCAMKAGFIW